MGCFCVPCPKISVQLGQSKPSSRPFLPPPAGSSSLRNSLAFQASNRKQYEVVRLSTQLNAVKSSHSQQLTKKVDAIAAFMNQVADLVELVDSRDIMELHLKQHNCQVLIRKKEALPHPPAPPYVMMQSPSPPAMAPPHSSPAKPAPAAASTKALPNSSHPPLKCPMAGTFYRCPSPGAPPFVKVGDKVQKGQVICIIEAMKLMNDIEADHAGTVVDILVEDGKPVSVDMPLFIIEP